MNNSTAAPSRVIRTPVSPYDVIKQDICELKEMFAQFKEESDFNRACIMNLIKQLSPVFPAVDSFENEGFPGVRKNIDDARSASSATVVNPNLHGLRDIELVVDEIVAYKIETGMTTYPTDKMRIQGLINVSLKNSTSLEERNYTFNSPMVAAMYSAMKKMVLPFHTKFIQEFWELNGCDSSGVLPNWSDIDATLKLKHFLLLEGELRGWGHILHRCKGSWASDRLFYNIHKSRRNGSLARSRAAGNGSSAFSVAASSTASLEFVFGGGNDSCSDGGDEDHFF